MIQPVDGQQRLTTLIILLKCIELALAKNSDDRDDLAKGARVYSRSSL
jgi:uncharacterized protein with ParB-like and HNH nuclease domain